MALELQARGEASELARFPDRPPRRQAAGGRRAGTILRPGRNAWRVERAARAAVLIDGAAFFRAVREALRKAQHTVFIIGWDIDSRMRLVGEDCEPDDGMPITFVDFLSALVRERPDLTVHLLLWDYSVLYALERELFPTLALHWATPRQVRVCLDDELPLGSSHHQKIIVVDDAVAFSGGLDLTIRRWDTSDHRLDNPDRVDPSGKPYRPFHDVQALVDGPAAHALAELARARWTRASSDLPTEVEPDGDPWPDSVPPDLRDVDVGIARTLPFYEDEEEVREVEALFCDSIAAAERAIYIENQFVTSPMIAEQLARTLRDASPARDRDRGAAALRFLDRSSHHAQRPHPLHADAAGGGRRGPRAPALSGSDRRRAHGQHDDPLEGLRRRRPPAAGRLGQSQQPLDGHRHRMRSRLRGADKLAPACHP